MYRPHLPAPRPATVAAFTDSVAAQHWLSTLAPEATADILWGLCAQVAAIDGSTLAPPQAVALLNLLRSAIVPRQASAEARFTRKALPMADDEEGIFDATQQLWTQLGIAYLRLAPNCTPANRCLPLHRAASAFRIAQYCHYLASRSCPPLLDQLLFDVLATAESNGVLRRPIADPDFPQYGKGSVSGELAWALLMRHIDPYRLNALQVPVANRIFSRWRELVPFELTPGEPGDTLDLAALGAPEALATQHFVNIRTVIKKLGQRIQLLREGHSPEALKLGRVLSAPAAARLLQYLDSRFRPQAPSATSSEQGEFDLVYGGDSAYMLLTNSALNVVDEVGAAKRATSYQRMAIFGLDRVSELPPEMQRLKVPSERWSFRQGLATRIGPAIEQRIQAPALIGAMINGKRRLGIMQALIAETDGTLKARIEWLDEGFAAGSLKHLAPRGTKLQRVPAFLLAVRGGACALVVPPDAGARLGLALELSGFLQTSVTPSEILERGSNFVHYACEPLP